MAFIELVRTPRGQAPEWVREEWVGLFIPLASDVGPGTQRGALGGAATIRGGHHVEAAEAFIRLGGKSADAYDWWVEYSPRAFMSYLVFDREACRVADEEPVRSPEALRGERRAFIATSLGITMRNLADDVVVARLFRSDADKWTTTLIELLERSGRAAHGAIVASRTLTIGEILDRMK